MATRIALLAVAVIAAGCSNSDDSDDSALLEDPGSGTVVEVFSDSDPELSTDVITLDNHIELLNNVFAIYSGKLWAEEVLVEPDFDDRLVSLIPVYTSSSGELISTPVDVVCENGGTVGITPYTDGNIIDAVASWNFEFENCQKEDAIRDGQIEREVYESVRFISTGYSNTAQSRQIEFSGDLLYSTFGAGADTGLGYLKTENVSFLFSDNVDNLTITESSVTYSMGFQSGISGGYHVVANWTDDRELTVSATSDLVLDAGTDIRFTSGLLEVRDGNDNALVLDVDNGDVNTVDITITAGGVSETVTEPWSLWSDSFRFFSATGF